MEPEQELQAGVEFGEAQGRRRVASGRSCGKQRLGRVDQRGIVQVTGERLADESGKGVFWKW